MQRAAFPRNGGSRELGPDYVLGRLRSKGASVFTLDEYRMLLGLYPHEGYQVIYRLEAAGAIRRIHQSHYVLREFEEEAFQNPSFLGTRLVEPSYVAFDSALAFYGWTERVPSVVHLANTRVSEERRVDPHRLRYIRLAPRRFFGYAEARQGPLAFPVAEPEKAIVDAVFLSRLCGGMGGVAAALEAARRSLDLRRLVDYAVRMDVKVLCSRLGYLLERLGTDASALDPHKSPVGVPLDPEGPREGRWVARWNVIDNLGGA